MEGRKFAILQCAEESDYVRKMYGGYYGVFVRMLKEDGETWDLFKVARGEFPADDEIAEYDSFVITGSCSHANGNALWICKLVVLLQKLDAMKKKVLGICFGHQVCILFSYFQPILFGFFSVQLNKSVCLFLRFTFFIFYFFYKAWDLHFVILLVQFLYCVCTCFVKLVFAKPPFIFALVSAG